jgi:hypothetical protein
MATLQAGIEKAIIERIWIHGLVGMEEATVSQLK